MNTSLSKSSSPRPPSVHHFENIFNIEFPFPVLERGWLHARESTQAWYVERFAAELGSECWLSYYQRDEPSNEGASAQYRAFALAGFWPDGGFVELQMRRGNPLEAHLRGVLTVYAESASHCEQLMAYFHQHYRHGDGPVAAQPRVGILNASGGELYVERIPISTHQVISRDDLELYYGAGMSAWVGDWIQSLNTRRYGLSVLTGAPGTGKTTLIRSLSHWLGGTHMFYFMPATRFGSVDSSELVKFWAEENRNSALRKVLIIEDAESVLLRRAADNRESVATLLNLTDGMLGDALGLNVVCTLNSHLDDIDAALLRPGRLLAHREFRPLTRGEAARLAEKLGLPVPDRDSVSLAELLNPARPVVELATPQKRTLGFHVARSSKT